MNDILFKGMKPKYLLLYLFSLLFLFIIYLFFNINSYDLYTIDSLIICSEDCYIEFERNINNSSKYDYLVIDDVKYEIKDINISEPYVNSINVGVQKIKILFNKKNITNNSISTIELYSNKDILINKIINLLIRKE